MNSMLDSGYIFIGIYLIVAIGFALFPIILARIVNPKKHNPLKNEPYECGLKMMGDPWIQFGVQYYIYALVFVVFDVEILFVYPWAVSFKELGILGFIEMAIFLAILFAGFIFAYKRRALEWE